MKKPTTKRADSKLSEGARMERAAFRRYLRRQIAEYIPVDMRVSLELALKWVLAREKRFNARRGGLGR